MSSCREPRRALALAALGLALAFGAHAAERFANVGRSATPKELQAWDIDVRPDFKGLPKGAGTVDQGQAVWEAKCAGCHGVFGESNEVFTPIVGGTTKEDVATGRVARLTDTAYPQRTMFMKLATVSTLWDYINRAMPWTAPKSLKTDEVYAVTAYLLNLADVVPADFELNERSIREVKLPNRNGMTTAHAMWPGPEFGKPRAPDAQGKPCMKDCLPPGAAPEVASKLPEHARTAHGNLAAQQRTVGAQRGADTAPPGSAAQPSAAAPDVGTLLRENACLACHQIETKAVGPAFRDVAARHGERSDGAAYLAGKIRQGSTGAWGAVPMPPQPIGEADAARIAQWLMSGAKP